jgi:Xaa-Pro aminopeptidase
MRYENVNPELFKQNRKNFARQMKKGSVAIFISNPVMPKSADAGYKWRQNPDLYYLTGIDQEDTYLILFPDNPHEIFREVLLTRRTNEVIMVWEGKKHSREEASRISGIENVQWSDNINSVMDGMIIRAEHIYLNTNENDRAGNPFNGETQFAKEIMEKYPLHKYERSAPIMASLREAKSNYEIAVLNKAIDITRKGFLRTLKFIKPGVWEYEIEAEIIHEYIRNRGTGHAYEPIVATGANACILHYNTNDQQCKDGELVLMDCGAEYGNYCADLTRTVPVNGKYSKRQKEVYNAVMRVFKEGRSMMKAGEVLNDINTEAGKIMESELIGLKLLDKQQVKKQDKKNPLYKKYYPHGLGHFLGLDVHDIGNRFGKLKPGAVLTCEPGIYIPEEKLGIRTENNILLTNGKPIDLMANIPIDADEIEDLMNSKK